MTTRYLLPCAQCDQQTPIEISQAGGSLPCSGCGTSLEVPSLRLIRQLEPLESVSAKPASRAPRDSWSVLQGQLFSGGLVLMLGAGIALAFLIFTISRIDTKLPITPDDERVQFKQGVVDRFSAYEAMEYWNTQVLDEPLGEWKVSEAVKNRKRVRSLTLISIAVGCTAILGLIVTVCSFFLKAGREKKQAT